MAKVQCVLLVAVIAAVWSSVSALTDAEKDAIKAVFIPLLEECGKEHGISLEEILEAKKTHNVEALHSCFYACVGKKTGLIDDKGQFAVGVAKEHNKKFFKDEEILGKLDAVLDDCAKVNDQEVSDGAEGCDRAKLLALCMAEHKDSISTIYD